MKFTFTLWLYLESETLLLLGILHMRTAPGPRARTFPQFRACPSHGPMQKFCSERSEKAAVGGIGQYPSSIMVRYYLIVHKSLELIHSSTMVSRRPSDSYMEYYGRHTWIDQGRNRHDWQPSGCMGTPFVIKAFVVPY